MHPRIVVNEVCFPSSLTLEEEIEWWTDGAIDRVGLSYFRRANSDWLTDGNKVRDAGISVGYLLHERMYQLSDPATWTASIDALKTTIDAAVALAVPTIYTTTGPAGSLEFDEAARALATAFQPVREYAHAAGVEILTETTNPLFAHTHFLHTLADTASVAAQVGLKVCLDLYSVWWERGLRSTIAATGNSIRLVQVSDFAPIMGPPTTENFVRQVPGDGVIPLDELVACVLDTGYQGLFDLELYLRPSASALADTCRAIEWLTDVLERLGI